MTKTLFPFLGLGAALLCGTIAFPSSLARADGSVSLSDLSKQLQPSSKAYSLLLEFDYPCSDQDDSTSGINSLIDSIFGANDYRLCETRQGNVSSSAAACIQAEAKELAKALSDPAMKLYPKINILLVYEDPKVWQLNSDYAEPGSTLLSEQDSGVWAIQGGNIVFSGDADSGSCKPITADQIRAQAAEQLSGSSPSH